MTPRFADSSESQERLYGKTQENLYQHIDVDLNDGVNDKRCAARRARDSATTLLNIGIDKRCIAHDIVNAREIYCIASN